MEKSKREKAIMQAQASLKIDRIYLKPEFISAYRSKHGLQIQNTPKLTLKRSTNNGIKQ